MTDNELVEIVRSKDPERFGEIVDRYRDRLFVYICRLIGSREEAEDLLQDIFIKVFKNLNSFDVERKFSSWIYRIAHNESINYIKKKSLRKLVYWDDISSSKDKIEASNSEEGSFDKWIRREMNEEVEEAMKRLPVKYRQILLLRYYLDKSYDEISEILDKPINTVGTLINRSKKKIKEEIEKIREANNNLNKSDEVGKTSGKRIPKQI